MGNYFKTAAFNHDLCAGGAGSIGSHTVAELLNAGHEVTIFDNFYNSQPEVLNQVKHITGKLPTLVQGDIRDTAAFTAALRASGAATVIHFAGLKAVGESVVKPLDYYDHNVVGTVRLLQAMTECGVKTLVFSSSATVYGDPQRLPLTEDHPLSTTNPYGQTKLVIEEMLRDLYRSDPGWRISILRYFNPIGAHASGLIGENPPRYPQRSAAVCGTGGRGAARVSECVGRRLFDPRRHWRARLHPRGEPGDGTPQGT